MTARRRSAARVRTVASVSLASLALLTGALSLSGCTDERAPMLQPVAPVPSVTP